MCGFAGFLDRAPSRDALTLAGIARDMAETLRHRGPDDGGVWVDAAAGYAVGFRRLAIVDLSPEGHQPMVSAGGRLVLAFNGEIYNHAELRQRLLHEGPVDFRGHSDTEVLLAGFERWGVEQSLRRCAGMYAFALWDRSARALTLGRDRLGEKPLYCGWAGNTFLFGSELKALRQHPDFANSVRRDALVPYLRHGYIPSPHSIYEGIHKLPPGTTLCVHAGQECAPAPVAYWSVGRASAAGQAELLADDGPEAAGQLEAVLRRTIADEMVADVPLGAFLSGGVDSSAVVALMQTQSRRPVRTFTVGFDDADFNEAEFARAVAAHLGTEHTELYLTPAQALDVVPRLPALYDEPFADPSQIPTYLVAWMARQHVTVSLSGDGGDEVFGGYTWYNQSARLWRLARCVPPALGRLAGQFVEGALSGAGLLAGRSRFAARVDRCHKVGTLLRHVDRVENMHQWLIGAHWEAAGQPLLHAAEPASPLNDRRTRFAGTDVLGRLQCFDLRTYLPDDILVKVDRASMGVSLESRAPFLDHRVVEFAFRLPTRLKVRDGQTKWLLRQVLYKYVPRELIDRPKQGFCVPLAAWLRGPLRDWAAALLDPHAIRRQGYFRPAVIERVWREHQEGRRNWERQLWYVLMFQAWLETASKGTR